MTREPAVLLLSPGIIRWTDMDFGLPHLVSLGGYVREHTGVRVEILDLNYEGGDRRSLQRTLDELGPFLLIGLSCYSSFDYRRVMALARYLRERFPGVPLVTGGYHASALPHDVVHDGSPFDAVIVGEGEEPLREIVEGLLGGEGLKQPIYGPATVPDLDALPPYAWDLLARYWPRATDIGRKLQIVLARGCPYHCTFCMERAKSGYSWRPYSAERAVDELDRLSRWTDLSQWVVNIADPLFGFQRRWRRQVLQGILDRGIVPRQFWTLTRSDDLHEQDISLLARARFSIGIGIESGSPRMLTIMQKGNHPRAYLDNMLRVARLSRQHGLTWATNVIVGHPGETPESLRETHSYLTELFTAASETCGWLSIDPFRLYPGAHVHEQLESWEQTHGARFHHPTWWHDWYDGWFRAQHLEPSSELSFEERVRFQFDSYGPLIEQVQARFRGQGRDIDRVFARSLAEQRDLLSPQQRDRVLQHGRAALAAKQRHGVTPSRPRIPVPLGLHLKDPWVRRREEAVRRLLDRGVLRTAALIEALLQVGPERFMDSGAAQAVLAGRTPNVGTEGLLPAALDLRLVAMGLEALEPAKEDRVVDLGARTGWVAALLAELVGPRGQVRAVHAGPVRSMLDRLEDWPQVHVQRIRARARLRLHGTWDGIWLGAALPHLPHSLRQALEPRGGRMVSFLGPRFGTQDLVSLTRHDEHVQERIVARAQIPVVGAAGGWIPAPQAAEAPAGIHAEYRPAAARAFDVLAHLDLGPDAASLYRGAPPTPWSEALKAAYLASPRRLHLQALPLLYTELSDLEADLQDGRWLEQDPELARAFLDGLRALAAPSPPLHEHDVHDSIIGPITQLRSSLWSAQPTEPPPLTLVDCPALAGTGRAITHDGRRYVGVSFAVPELAVMQVLHEEVHVITDPLVRQEWPGTEARDTRAGSPGHGLHQALESVAVQATHALLEERASDWIGPFTRWQQALGEPRLRSAPATQPQAGPSA